MTKVRDFICRASLIEDTLFSRLMAKSWGDDQRNTYELNGLNRGLKSGVCDGMTWGEDVLSACYGVVSGYWDFTLCHEHYR